MTKQIVVCVLVGLLATACVTNRAQRGGTGGAAAGAIIGQIIGHDTEATLLGAAIGGMLGYVIGNEMDKEDRRRLTGVYEYSPDNKTTDWVNPNTGNEYRATPHRTYKEPRTSYDCREVEILATIDGKPEKTYSTACREDGKWVMR